MSTKEPRNFGCGIVVNNSTHNFRLFDITLTKSELASWQTMKAVDLGSEHNHVVISIFVPASFLHAHSLAQERSLGP